MVWKQRDLLADKGIFRTYGILIFYCNISVEGFVMDQFCVQLGTLLDKPNLMSLQFPNEHSLHWYV
jgi:hypothetical protein